MFQVCDMESCVFYPMKLHLEQEHGVKDEKFIKNVTTLHPKQPSVAPTEIVNNVQMKPFNLAKVAEDINLTQMKSNLLNPIQNFNDQSGVIMKYSCDKCNKKFSEDSSLQRHRKEYHLSDHNIPQFSNSNLNNLATPQQQQQLIKNLKIIPLGQNNTQQLKIIPLGQNATQQPKIIPLGQPIQLPQILPGQGLLQQTVS